MFICDLPRIAVGRSFLADPMEAVSSDLSETPSSFQTARVIADLDNVLTLGPPDLARVILVERVSPDDVPAPDPGIEDAQSCAIHRGRRQAANRPFVSASIWGSVIIGRVTKSRAGADYAFG